MLNPYRFSIPLCLILLGCLSGCHCFPSVRYRNPHSPAYEAACTCGQSHCEECQCRCEKTKPVPWSKFHPVPTRPVFQCVAPAAGIPYESLPYGAALDDVPYAPDPVQSLEEISTPYEMHELSPPGEIEAI